MSIPGKHIAGVTTTGRDVLIFRDHLEDAIMGKLYGAQRHVALPIADWCEEITLEFCSVLIDEAVADALGFTERCRECKWEDDMFTKGPSQAFLVHDPTQSVLYLGPLSESNAASMAYWCGGMVTRALDQVFVPEQRGGVIAKLGDYVIYDAIIDSYFVVRAEDFERDYELVEEIAHDDAAVPVGGGVMSSFWWMQPGWTATRCGDCGANIWDAGGDPDHGVCPACFDRRYQGQSDTGAPPCDVCGQNEILAGANGLGVCSLECEHEAMRRTRPEEERP